MSIRAGAILLFLGGVLLAGGGFLPVDSNRTHWGVFQEAINMFLEPDSGLPWNFYVYYAAQVLGLGYPFLCGILLALASFFRDSRIASFLFCLAHSLFLAGLMAAAIILTVVDVREEGQSWLKFLGIAVLIGILLSMEIMLAVRGTSRVDAPNLPPAVFILILYTALFLYLHDFQNWPVTGYLVGGGGALLAIGGMALRWRSGSAGKE